MSNKSFLTSNMTPAKGQVMVKRYGAAPATITPKLKSSLTKQFLTGWSGAAKTFRLGGGGGGDNRNRDEKGRYA